MDPKPFLRQVWDIPFLKKLPVRSLVATLLASVIHPALGAIGFELPAAAAALAKVGFVLAGNLTESLLPALIEAAKQGVEKLAEWLEQAVSEKAEVNEAAAHTLVENAEPVAQTLEDARPQEKVVMAAAVEEGLKSYGGATAEIATSYAAALKDLAEARKLVAEMQAKLGAWSRQTMEARRGSLIAYSEQHIEGKGEQSMVAEDNSRIIGSKQTIKKG